MTGRSYRGYRPRPRPEGIRPLERGLAPEVPEAARPLFAAVEASFAEPYRGITTDGTLRNGLYHLDDTGQCPPPLLDAARGYTGSLTAGQRLSGVLPLDAAEWRIWTNAFPTWAPHGLLLDDLSHGQRGEALAMMAASLSARGFADVRTAMRLNALLGELIGDYGDTLAEWVYWLTIFGDPSPTEPWGWQLAGHHIDVHCLVLGGQMVLTPTFLGAEAAVADRGSHQGARLFDEEQARGLAVIRSLSTAQRERAVLYPSMLSKDLPPALADPVDGRHRGGAGQDNLVLPYEGVAAEALTTAQRDLLLALVDTYVARMPGSQRERKMAEVGQHLPDTHFAWIGGWSEGTPFYYRVHSPVLLIEFDHHSGVFLDNDEPEPFHVHTIVRTPNGNDYGKDLLSQHYARFHRAPAAGWASSHDNA